MLQVAAPKPTSLAKDGDEDPFEDDLDTDDTSSSEAAETIVEESWVRVNDKAPIWMRLAPLPPLDLALIPVNRSRSAMKSTETFTKPWQRINQPRRLAGHTSRRVSIRHSRLRTDR